MGMRLFAIEIWMQRCRRPGVSPRTLRSGILEKERRTASVTGMYASSPEKERPEVCCRRNSTVRMSWTFEAATISLNAAAFRRERSR